MKIMGAACSILIIGASLATAAGGSGCVLSFDDSGLARMQTGQGGPQSVQTLCRELRTVMAERPALARALARHDARLSLNVLTARPHLLSIQLVLHQGGRDTPGDPLQISQVDGGPPAFDTASLNRLAQHLVDADPIRTFATQP